MLVISGFFYAMAVTKSHAWEPEVIRAFFAFDTPIIPKFLLSAAGTSAACFAVLDRMGDFYGSTPRFVEARLAQQEIALSRTWFSVIVGGILAGSGMTACGATPDFLIIQLGAGVSNSYVTFIGAVFGALTYGLCFDRLIQPFLLMLSRFACIGPMMLWKETHFDGLLRMPFSVLALIVSFICLFWAFTWEGFSQWQWEMPGRLQGRVSEAVNVSDCGDWLTCAAWPPTAAGFVVGLLQVPMVVMLDCFIPDNEFYQFISSWMSMPLFQIRPKLTETFQYSYAYAYPPRRIQLQGIMFIAVLFWTLIWESSVSDLGKAPGFDTGSTFLGGFFMMLGVRICAGGLSASTINGVGALMIYGPIVFGSMLGGGWITTWFWSACGGVKDVTEVLFQDFFGGKWHSHAAF